MGEVFRARDRASGEAVAVKILLESRSGEDRRFAREAAVLSELRHPGIVRYVAHGATDTGEPYLAMEWLEGEDLACRLARGALAVDETITLLTRVAEALAAAHARGVVHRDLKPSNLFLVGREIGQVKVLDFGIARRGGATPITKTGAVVGTPGYMAPEQVRSGGDVDARADVFALGCVLFECLTGTPLFTGEHFMAILAKILFREAPRLREQAPDIPPALDVLCARMLAKERDERPRDGAAVADALAALDADTTLHPEAVTQSSGGLSSVLTGSERRVRSVVLLRQEPAFDNAAPTLGRTEIASAAEELCRMAEAHGGRLEVLADGSAIVSIAGVTRIATDQAAQAARCALALHALCPERPMALATGRAEVMGMLLVGDAIDRAARMLSSLASDGRRLPLLAIDEVTAGLLDARFEIVESTAGLELRGEHALAEGARTLLGKPTPCVGRDWELGTLDALLTQCVQESMARVVLITAPAGMGKSRVAYEVIGRSRRWVQGLAIWIGRGDSLRAGSTFGLLSQALRNALEIQDGETLEARRRKLRTRVAKHVVASEQRRVTEFLGELVGTPFPEEDSILLRSARQDARLMGDQMRRAWLDFLRAETAAHPVLLVLEDLHWGDSATVQFLDAALRELPDKPCMVLALARPEVHTLFPKLWADRGFQEIRLKELSRKASERLVRQMLDESVGAETVERIVTQADGHAFYLEELIRAVAEGKGAALPETVLAMVEMRLARLERKARWMLRAASIFGEVFWLGGVVELLGGGIRMAQTGELLSRLVEQEGLVERPESRFPGEREFVFRHALLREGAYAMLTEQDRELGHRLAGRWLEQRGETDSMVLAEHFERGKEAARAASAYLRAAEHALRGDDLEAVINRAERGIACGSAGEELGGMRLVESEAHLWRGELSLAEQRGNEAVSLLVPGSTSWFHAVQQVGSTMNKSGRSDRILAWVESIRAVVPATNAFAAQIICLCSCAENLTLYGHYAETDALLEMIQHITQALSAPEASVIAALQRAQAFRFASVGALGPCLEAFQEALAAFEQVGDRRNACNIYGNLGSIFFWLGDFESAERASRTALSITEQMGLYGNLPAIHHSLGLILAYEGQIAEGRRLEQEALSAFLQHGDARFVGITQTYLARISILAGNLDEAERDARNATASLVAVPVYRAHAFAVLADALLNLGRIDDALDAARRASSLLEEVGEVEEGGVLIRLLYAEALHATGDLEGAHAAIHAARDRLLVIAATIGDRSLRRSLLENSPENVRTLSLARAWLGGAPSAPEASSTDHCW
jgi:tetratricopeptide (TPR) repeat protein